MKITLESLLTLDAIVRKGSFAAAAAELHKAQSAVSYGVRQLESALGVSVFDRAGHRAVLTDAGRAILDESRAILARAKRLEERAGRFSEAWEPRFELVADGIVPMAPIMGLARMTEEGVPTILRLKVEFLGGVQDGFERDEADAMIVKDFTSAVGDSWRCPSSRFPSSSCAPPPIPSRTARAPSCSRISTATSS
ncbi:MAG: LysR family transcriptional regulator [Polyangiaceae bacterium]